MESTRGKFLWDGCVPESVNGLTLNQSTVQHIATTEPNSAVDNFIVRSFCLILI